MSSLNYHHLQYFWVVASEGSIARASVRLKLSQPAISTQLKTLEANLGEALFERRGRNLVLTEAGRVAFRYAEEIFSTGKEMLEALRGGAGSRPARFIVGVADVLPKLVVHKLLLPARQALPDLHLICREDKADRLLGQLGAQELDLMLSDAPVGAGSRVRAFNHPLGASSVSFFGVAKLAQSLRPHFPRSLHGAPVLLPTETTELGRALRAWFEARDLQPRVLAEFDDSALLKVFAQCGEGVCAAPSMITGELRSRYGLLPIGPAEGVLERFYAISAERRIRHPAVSAIAASAREN